MDFIEVDERGNELLAHVKSNSRVYFDIETGPVENIKELFKPPDFPKHPEFDPSLIKYGNIKDPSKKAEKYEEHKKRYEKSLLLWDEECKTKAANEFAKFVEDSPLSSVFGRVFAIGYGIDEIEGFKIFISCQGSEVNILNVFWEVVGIIRGRGKLISFNGSSFDIPFITRRSWVNRIIVPYLLTKYKKMEDWIIDIYDVWKFGKYNDHIKLNELAQSFGLPGKLDGVTGDMFWKLMKTDQQLAKKYLASDIACLRSVERRIGMGV